MTNPLRTLILASTLLLTGAGAALALPPWVTGGSLGSDPTVQQQQQQQQEQRNRAVSESTRDHIGATRIDAAPITP
ncbi:MAG: hypothetical protein JO320_13880 [Alphaproteobacteria bacterium]|nr:hypothetical protein [Acetobacteraceae bacterium]MBV9376122.1 hypothetical protein [Alphaproteobacteria bacterium]